MIRITEVVKHLLIINVIVFFGAQIFLGPQQTMLYLFYPGTEQFHPYQFISHMFMHGGIGHLMFNMLTLFFLGPMVEAGLGARRFLAFYLICGAGALGMHMFFMQPGDAVVGASGAIYGVLIAFAAMYPNIRLMLLFPPIPVKAKYLALGLMAFDLVSGVSSMDTGVAHFAHLGGAITGIVLLLIWGKVRLKGK